MFNFLHSWKSSPTLTWEMLGSWWENTLLFQNQKCPDMLGFAWNLQLWFTNLKVSYMYYMTGQNFTKILWGTDGNVALSVRVKVLLSFSSPLIRVPVLPSLSGARILNDLHLMTLGFWNKWCLCFLNCTENMLEFVWAFHLCAIKSNKGVIIFFSYCPRIQFCSIKFMSDILILTHLQLGLWLLLSA